MKIRSRLAEALLSEGWTGSMVDAALHNMSLLRVSDWKIEFFNTGYTEVGGTDSMLGARIEGPSGLQELRGTAKDLAQQLDAVGIPAIGIVASSETF